MSGLPKPKRHGWPNEYHVPTIVCTMVQSIQTALSCASSGPPGRCHGPCSNRFAARLTLVVLGNKAGLLLFIKQHGACICVFFALAEVSGCADVLHPRSSERTNPVFRYLVPSSSKRFSHRFPAPHLSLSIMRLAATTALVLPALTVAAQQVPLLDRIKGYLSQATAAVSSAIPSMPSSPVEAAKNNATASVASVVQHPLTLENWKEVLTVDLTASPPATQDWLIFSTGGNATCFGLCGNATKAWNVRPFRCPRYAERDGGANHHPVGLSSLPGRRSQRSQLRLLGL